MGLRGLAEGIPYLATTYDRQLQQHCQEEVCAGKACSTVLQELLPRFGDGVGNDQPSESNSLSVA